MLFEELLSEERAEGRAEGKAEFILELLEELGPVPAELSARIMSEKDEKKLSVWNKTAARVESVEQFMKSTAETIIV